MAIFEFECPNCKERVERLTFGHIERPAPLCAKCGTLTHQIEFSVPAKRNPEHGIQK